MQFRLLGPVEVEEEGRLFALGSAKQRALLAILLLHANEVVSRDRLIDELWGERAAGERAAQPRGLRLAAAKDIAGERGRTAADDACRRVSAAVGA